MSDPPVLPQPSERLVRTALLSARMFVDSLELQPLVRFPSFGLMDPTTALKVLARDVKRPPDGVPRRRDGSPRQESRHPAEPRLPTQSYIRLKLAVEEALESQEAQVRTSRTDPDELRASVQELTDSIETALPDDDDTGLRDVLSSTPRVRRDLGQDPERAHPWYAKDWSTVVEPTTGLSTHITSQIDVYGELNLVAKLCDPRRWSDGSLFWITTRAYGFEPPGGEPPELVGLADPRPPAEWHGRLREEVAGLAIFSVDLHIDYESTEHGWRMEYHWLKSPDKLTKDDGELTIEPIGDEGWLRATVTKEVDFLQAPFGGPSSGDILAPSFFSSWMRIQQDIWATHIGALGTPPASS